MEKFILHPDWNSFYQSYDADIAIIFVAPDITYSTYIQPICLPVDETNVIRVSGTVAGFGLKEGSSVTETKPRHVVLSSVDHNTCLRNDDRLASIGSNR